MKYLSKSYIYLVIFGDNFSPVELTNYLELEPTNFGTKGSPGPYSSILKECIWQYQLEETDALEGLEASLEKMINIFQDKTQYINDYVVKNDLSVKCFVVIKSKNKEDTGVLFPSKFIEFLNRINASLEVDTYNNPDGKY